MPDYDLGRARGKFTLDVDKKAFRDAEKSTDKLTDTTERLGEQAEDTTEKLSAQEKQQKKNTKATADLADKEAGLAKRMKEAEKAASELNDALDDLNDSLLDSGSSMDDIEKKTKKVTEARKKQVEADNNAASAAKALKSELNDLTMVIDKLPDKHEIKIDVDTRGAEDKLTKFNKKVMALRNAKMLGGLAGAGYGPLAKGGLYGSGGGILGGAAGLLGSGATGAGVNTIMGVVQAAGQLSGVLGLIPAAAGAAAFSVTSLQVATKGLGDAFGAAMEEDPEAFASALEQLSANAQELAIGFNTLVPEIKKAGFAIQDAFAEGLADSLMPLAQTYMPMITNGMSQIAAVANSVIKDLANMFMSPENMQMVQSFLDNTAIAANTLGQAVRPVAEAFLKIMEVGGTFLPQLAQDILDVANEFSAWITQLRDTGQLAEWIQTGIDSFKQLWGIIKTLGDALGRVFQIWEETGGGALGWLEKIVGVFSEWVNSAEGSSAISQFFTSINEALVALSPALKTLATALFGQIIPALSNLGVGMAPAITTFFKQIGDAFANLDLAALAGPLGQILTTLGEAFVQITASLGPELPGLFQSFADALTQLLPYLPSITDAIVQFATEIMQYLPGIADDIGYLLPRIIGFIGVIKNLQTGLIAGATQILHWLGELSTGFLQFMTNLTTVWPTQAGEAARGFFSNLGGQITGGLSVVWDALTSLGNKIQEFFTGMWNTALDAGRHLIENLMQGIRDKLSSLGDVAKSIVTTITDWLPGSPAKKGPLSGAGWSYRRGQSLAEDFAAGVDAASGGVNKSTGKMAGGASEGMSGFVEDMLQLTSFTSRLVGLFKDIANIVFDVVKFATTDPVTGKSTIKPKWERTVSDDDLRRKREDKSFSDAWGEANKPKSSDDQSNPSRTGPAGKELATYYNKDPKGADDVAKMIIAEGQRRGWSQEQILAALGVANQETAFATNPRTNAIQNQNGTPGITGLYQQDMSYRKYGDPRDINNAITGFMTEFENRGKGLNDPNPWRHAVSDVQIPAQAGAGGYNDSDGSYLRGRQRANALEIYNRLAGSASSSASSAGPATAKYSTGGGSIIDALTKIGAKYGVKPTSTLREGDPGYHGKGMAVDFAGTPEDMAKFANFVADNFLGITKELIHEGRGFSPSRNIGDKKYVDPSKGEYYSDSTMSQHSSLRGGNAHVHWATDVAPILAAENAKVLPGAAADPRQQAIAANREIASSQGALPQRPSGAAPEGMTWDYTQGKWVPVDQAPPVAENVPPGTNAPKPDYENGPGIPEDMMVRDADGRLVVADEGDNAKDQLSMNESLLQEMQSQDASLDEAIRIGQDPNSSDAQVADSLSAIDDRIASLAGTDSPEARAQTSALQSIQGQIAGDRGMGQAQNPVDQAAGIFNGAAGMVGDILQVVDGVIKSIGAASEISSTLVRGIKNTEDIYNLIDQVQVFIDLAAKIAGAVSSVASFAGGLAGAGGPFGGMAGQALQGVAAMAGMVQAVLQAVNAAIDLGQEAYRIGSKYLARFLGYLIGGPAGSLIGDIKFLLDEQTGELHAWSDQNPEDKRTHQVPGWMQSGVDRERGNKIRDLNIYAGPGQDPAETMNAAMWAVTSDQGGVFTSEY